jgi:hypothetical protein
VTKPRKIHPADAADRADGARCQEFNAFMFCGQGRRLVGPRTTLAEAAAQARAWEIENAACCRKAAVYGHRPEGGAVMIYQDVWRSA